MTTSQTGNDRADLLTEAARACADDAQAALPRLLALAREALVADPGAVFGRGNAGLRLAAGPDREDLRRAAEACLTGDVPVTEDVSALALTAGGETLGVWAVSLPDAESETRWRSLVPQLAPFFALALRQKHWQQAVTTAQEQAERHLREVTTVFEVGQAIDTVDIERLLNIITEKAAHVMDAQACSLLLKLPDANSLLIVASCGLPDEVVENTRIFVGEGIAGKVAATGEPLLLNNLGDDPRFRGMSGMPEVTSSICMPMKDVDGHIHGVLCIRRRAPAPLFTDDDVKLFGIFATQAALAVNNAQLIVKLNLKIRELSTLAALTETVSSSLDLDHVLNQVADNLIDVVHFDRCRIYIKDMETDRFSPRIVRGFPWREGGGQRASLPVEEVVIEMVARRQTPIPVEDIASAPGTLRAYGEALGMDAFYAQPIVARGRCIGVLVVSNDGPHRPIARASIALLSTFVHQAGIAIENARFYAGQERRYRELTTLYEVSSTLAVTSGVQSAAQTINDLAVKITESDAGLLLLFDETQEAINVLHWRGVSDAVADLLKSFHTSLPTLPSARTLQAPFVVDSEAPYVVGGPEWQPFRALFLKQHPSTAIVPLTVDEAPIGFLILGKRRGEFSAATLSLIAAASSQAAAVLAGAQAYERRIGQRELELSALREMMQEVRAATTLEEALNSILDIVGSLVWSDNSQLLTVNADRDTMTVRAARGERGASEIGGELPLAGDSLAAQALRERDEQGERTARIVSGPPEEAALPASRLALPLTIGDELIGVLTMESRIPDLYTEDSVKLLHLVASQAVTIYREMSSLRALTRYTDNILRSIAAGVMTVNKDGQIATWNRRAEEIIGLRADEIIGCDYGELIERLQVDPVIRGETMHMLEITAQTGKIFTRNQLCYRSVQGDETYVNLSASQLKSESGEHLGIVIVFEDITGEIHMKEEVERVRRLAETGQLAANIAHELRNPLASIKGAAQLLRNDLPADYVAEHGEFLDMIVDEVNGLNRMTSEFLEFSRAPSLEMRSVDVNLLLGRSLQFMSTYLSGHEITYSLALDDNLPPLWADKSQLEQVVKNIVINAAQAMPHGGHVTASTRFFAASQIAEISFTDNGVGIPPDKMEQIWTPFFTTKTKGTGLGLAIARKIVETHGGRLSVKSALGSGSTFTLHLPIGQFSADHAPPTRAEMTDQRSDRPRGVAELAALYETGT